MKPLAFVLAAALLCACQTASYKETSQLAGTSWHAVDRGSNPRSYEKLDFGAKLAPSGMGNVELARGFIGYFQVIDGKLVIRYDFESKNHYFEYNIAGDELALTALGPSGAPLGVQHFKRDGPSPSPPGST